MRKLERKHIAICLAAVCAAAASNAPARVYGIGSSQSFHFPNHSPHSYGFARNVVVKGNDAFAIVTRPGGRQVVMFHRGTDGLWTQGAAPLADVDTTDNGVDDLALGDGVLAVRIGPNMQIFRRSGGAWVKETTAGTPQPLPFLAASGQTILAPRRGCGQDANVYEKSLGSGVWRVNGRITGDTSVCGTQTGVALDGNVALLQNSSRDIGVFRRNGSNFDWVQEGTLVPPSSTSGYFFSEPPTLRGDVAVADGGLFFLRGASGWQYRQWVQPLDAVNSGPPGSPRYDGRLLTGISSGGDPDSFPEADLYQRNAAGRFEHAARLYAYGYTRYADANGSVAITSSEDEGYEAAVEFYDLPSPFPAPRAVVNDFEARDVSNIQQSAGSSFALTNTGSNYVYRQSTTSGQAHAVLTNTDWSYSQKIVADIVPATVDINDRWAGLAVRYIDANNHYYLTLRSSGTLQLKKEVDGVVRTLDEMPMPVNAGTTYHVELNVSHTYLWADVTNMVTRQTYRLSAEDSSLSHGRTALMTARMRADFDNVLAAPTNGFTLAQKPSGKYDSSAGFTKIGGTWTQTEEHEAFAESQTSTSGDTRAYFGEPTDDQRIVVTMRLDQFGTSTSGAWIGVLARWVDSRNFYYLTLRSTDRLEIRKQVNGVITTLKSVPFPTVPGHDYHLTFDVVGNELHAYVDGTLMAAAIDSDIARGQYGLGSYRGAFTYSAFGASEP